MAILSDIHANLTAFEAVLADLKETSPDLIVHGGDLADGSCSGPEVVDRIRELGWQGVMGNIDELMFDPNSLEDFAKKKAHLALLWEAIHDRADYARNRLGAERIKWLRTLPKKIVIEQIALVHASPNSVWIAPSFDAPDSEFENVYAELATKTVVYGHIHHAHIRKLPSFTVVNTGSVGLPFDGDKRASYLLLDDGELTIRRVEFLTESEVQKIRESKMPYGEWMIRILETGKTHMPIPDLK